jgi:hypothetical protein
MNASQHVLESFWMLAAQDAMLDVAAVLAATERDTSAASIQPMANNPVLAMQWVTIAAPAKATL